MSDLIARLEAHDRLTHFDDVVALVEEAAAALRQKEAEIAELKRALDGAVRQMHEAKTERAHMEGRAEVAERQLSALRDQQPVAWMLYCPEEDVTMVALNKESLNADLHDNDVLTPLYAHPSCVSPDKPQPLPNP